MAKEMREFAAYVENMGKLGKKLLTPAGSQEKATQQSATVSVAFCVLAGLTKRLA